MLARILVRGGGDLASGIARRLFLAGLNVVILELPFPRAIRRQVSFAYVVHNQEITIDGVKGKLSSTLPQNRQDHIPVLIDEECGSANTWSPDVIIDARMRKKPPESSQIFDEPFLLGIGPDFDVDKNCHAIVETHRGHSLGRVLWQGKARENTHIPGAINGFTLERILRAPCDGKFQPLHPIGQHIKKGETVALIENQPLFATMEGILRGLLFPDTHVVKGQKVADIDPRISNVSSFTVSDKANAIAGGAMEAVLFWLNKTKL
jgi:xanthine dehydrogenase accessory factor